MQPQAGLTGAVVDEAMRGEWSTEGNALALEEELVLKPLKSLKDRPSCNYSVPLSLQKQVRYLQITSVSVGVVAPINLEWIGVKVKQGIA